MLTVSFPARGKERVQRMTYEQWMESKKQENREEKPLTKEPKSDIIKKRFTPVETETSRRLKALGVEYNEVKERTSALTESEIILRIAGGDMTKDGACASVALAYVGQRNGWDVLDFRDGDSRKFFSDKLNKVKMFQDLGATVITVNAAKTNITNGKAIFSQFEEGKEYYLSVGRHAAIVRKNGGSFQYLELQDKRKGKNGWVDFDDIAYTLRDRFKCNRSTEYYPAAHATDISQLKGDDFRTILGYINTSEEKQRKGAKGNVK